MADAQQDPLEFLKSLWSSTGFTPPGMVTPTLDVGELDKRIADLKAVEGWLKMNLNMLQMSIQGLEMQRATLSALQTMSQSQGSAEAPSNPFANPAPNSSAWPWNFMQPGGGATAPTEPEQAKTDPGRKRK
ncbi:MAG: hypothetical protein PHQ05_01285 [Sterolibacterium sp.]|nr:hypothetical protein [Sterolibacterium sp.]